MVPGVCGPSEGSLNEREEEEREKEDREEEEGEEEAIESIESDTACSLWEQKTKVREKQYLIRNHDVLRAAEYDPHD